MSDATFNGLLEHLRGITLGFRNSTNYISRSNVDYTPRGASCQFACGESYSFLFGGASSGRPVTERSAMQMTAVHSCVRILAGAVAGLPLHVYKTEADGSKVKAVEHPLYRLLHDEPNPEKTSFVFRETLMTHLLLWGNAFAQVIRNGRDEAIGLYPLQPNRMSVGRDLDTKQLYYEYQTSWDEPLGEYLIVRLTPADVLHIPGLGFDGLVSYSPIAMAKNAIDLAQATEDYGASFFVNGAAPGGVLHPGTIKDPSRLLSHPSRHSSWKQGSSISTRSPGSLGFRRT